MKLTDDILATLIEKVGKSLKPKTKQAVLDFYEKVKYFQQMPGKKDYVSVSLKIHE